MLSEIKKQKEINKSEIEFFLPEGMTEEGAVEVAERIRAQEPSGGLFSGLSWRVTPVPLALPKGLAEELERLGYRLWKFLRACDLLYLWSVKGKAPGWIAELLERGKPREVVELGRAKAFREQVYGVIRPDIILTEDGYFLSEVDSVPGGIGLTAWLNEVYTREGFAVMGGREGMLEGFSMVMGGGGDIYVSDEAGTYRPEMEWLAEALRAGGYGEYEVRSQRWEGPWKERVYRFFEMFDLENLPTAQRLLAEAAKGRVFVTAPPKAFLEEKLWFALFWIKPLEEFWRRELGSGVFQALQRVIPRTWVLNPEPLPPQAVYPGLEIQSWSELERFSQKKRQLVIKVSGFSELAWGARGVVVGHDLPAVEWAEALRRALGAFEKQPHILQEYRASGLHPCLFVDKVDKKLQRMLGRVRLCPYYFADGKRIVLGGVLATVCPADKKVVHGMSEAVLGPVSGA